MDRVPLKTFCYRKALIGASRDFWLRVTFPLEARNFLILNTSSQCFLNGLLAKWNPMLDFCLDI